MDLSQAAQPLFTTWDRDLLWCLHGTPFPSHL